MKTGAVLFTPRLVIRGWTSSDSDMDALHRLYSDEQVMRFFPYRMSRAEAAAKLAEIHAKAEIDGCGWAAVELRETDSVIGIAGLSRLALGLPFEPAVEIGWRFLPEVWRRGMATEAASAIAAHAFDALALEEIVALAVPENTASLGVMRAIGMHRDAALDFDHPKVPDTHPHLKRHTVFRLPKPS